MKATIISIFIAVALIGGVSFLGKGGDTNQTVKNVSIVDGKQIIDITAKGNYSPKSTTAQAGIPTVIKVSTNGTFDCTSALTIPALGYRNNLPPSGVTEIEVPPQEAGAKIKGICAMGMYNFSINFN